MVSEATALAEDVGQPWEAVALLKERFAVIGTALGSYEPMDIGNLPYDENRALIDFARSPLFGAELGAGNVVNILSLPVPPDAESLQQATGVLQDATDAVYEAWRETYFALELEPGGATAALIADDEECGVLRAMIDAGESGSGLDTIGPAAPG